MLMRASDLYEKEVICVRDGSRLGTLSDIGVNTETGCIETLIIYGRPHFFGLFGRDEDRIIPWGAAEVFGDDIILVDYEPPRPARRKSGAKHFLSVLADDD